MSGTYEREIGAAREAAEAAAGRILELYGPDVEVRWKGENDPVTAADEAATQVILKHLGAELVLTPGKEGMKGAVKKAVNC